MQGPYYNLNAPLPTLCERYQKPLPSVTQLRELYHSLDLPYPFYVDDWDALRRPNGGPFTAAMAISIQAFLGLNPMGLDVLVHTVSMPDHLDRTAIDRDFFGIWFDMVEDLEQVGFHLSGKPLVQKASDLEHAARDIEIAYGLQLEKDENAESPNLTKAAADYLQVKGCNNYPVGDYAYYDLLHRWWRQNPWTVLRAFRSNTSVGWSVLLPTTREVLDAIKRGDLAVWEIEAKHILNKSDCFFVEAAFDRPFIRSEKKLRKSRQVLANLLAQLAVAVPPGKEKELYGLSFAASQASAKRLFDGGFKYIPSRMKGSGFQLMEFGPQTSWIAKEKMGRGIQLSRCANRKLLSGSAKYH